MNVSLTPELEQLVNEKVKSGFYQTASEVVREALRLLSERDSMVASSGSSSTTNTRGACFFMPARREQGC